MDKGKRRSTILKIKYVTSMMNLIAATVSGGLMAAAVYLSIFAGSAFRNLSEMLSNGANPSSPVSGYVVTGEAFGLVFSLGTGASTAAIAVICLIALIWFLIPAILGFIACRKIRKQAEPASEEFCKRARRDSILKIIFVVLPVSGLILENAFSCKLVMVILFLTAIMVLEGFSLFLLHADNSDKY